MPRAHTLAGALNSQLAANILPEPAAVPGTYAGLVEAVGGTGAAAKILGVTPRTVQRQVNRDLASRGDEAAAGKQQRGFSPTQENKLATEVANVAQAEATQEGIDGIRDAGGLHVHYEGDVDIGGSDEEGRTFDYDIDDEYLAEPWQDEEGEEHPSFYDAIASGNRADIAGAFNAAFFASHPGFPPNSALTRVDELELGLQQ